MVAFEPSLFFCPRWILIGLTVVSACSDQMGDPLDPGDSGPPPNVLSPASLDFGGVAVNERRTLAVTVTAPGSAAYVVRTLSLNGDGAHFEVNSDTVLGRPLEPGTSTQLEVTYTPCPPAWNGAVLRSDFDWSSCPIDPVTATIDIADNTPENTRQISVAGSPLQRPQATLLCADDTSECGDPDATLVPCESVRFGAVRPGEPCDRLFELRNTPRAAGVTGPLVVDAIEVVVRNAQLDEVRRDAQAGFSLLAADRSALTLPLTVDVALGAPVGVTRFWLRFSGRVPGFWTGRPADEEGLRLATNDPNATTLSAAITAMGRAPAISVFPEFAGFDAIPIGSVRSATVSVRNDGDAQLQITDIRFADGGTNLSWATERGTGLPISVAPLERFALFITYRPTALVARLDVLEITSDDPNTPLTQVSVVAGPRPSMITDPADILTLEPEGTLRICNVGTAELIVSQLDLEVLGGSVRSADDFNVVDPMCSFFPCAVDIRLCAPSGGSPACACEELTIRHENNDASLTDQVNLIISTNVPLEGTRRVLLSGM